MASVTPAGLSDVCPLAYDGNGETLMAIDLSDEQRQALEAGRAVPIQDGPRTY